MAIIDKLRLSGTTYDIQDSNALKTVELTQAEYDALPAKDPNTYYVISDAQGVDISGKLDTSAFTAYSAATETVLSGKQETLVSGTNIKTINNESLLGSGNITIQGGSGGGMTEDDELLLATALTDLNDRKIDSSEVRQNYQKKGDYATKAYVTTALEPYETKLDEINTEEVTSYALNDLNNRFGGLKLVKITESEYAALTTKDENTLYVVIADQS